MIISGGSRSNWRFFSKHLMKAEENERVEVVEIRGLAAEDIREAFRELDALASGTRCRNFFYHANINPRADETLTPEQWEQAIDTLEAQLGFDGHSRFVVEHAKEGRTHRHVVWSRIDTNSMTAVSDSNNYAAHERAARTLEAAFGHEEVQGVHGRDTDTPRPDRRPENWETFRGHDSGVDPQVMKAELTDLWNHADSGKAFAAALEERGYVLCKGDRRDFCVVDQAGEVHSLARRIEGAKAKDIRARLADVDREALPGTEEAATLAKARAETVAAVEPPHLGHEQDMRPAGGGEARAAESPPASAWEEHIQQAQRAAEGQAAKPSTTEAAFNAFAGEVKEVMRSNGGEPRMHDGLTLWERVVAVVAIASLAWDAVTWVKGHWQNLVDQVRGSGTPEPGGFGKDDDGRER